MAEEYYTREVAYVWRELSPKERKDLLAWRTLRQYPWHSPPHRPKFGRFNFHISAACYEHAGIIGRSTRRMDLFSAGLLEAFREGGGVVHSWSVLPNHYHLLVQSEGLLKLLAGLGRFHGRMSHVW